MPFPTLRPLSLPAVEGRPFYVHVVSLLAKGNLSFQELFKAAAPLVKEISS